MFIRYDIDGALFHTCKELLLHIPYSFFHSSTKVSVSSSRTECNEDPGSPSWMRFIGLMQGLLLRIKQGDAGSASGMT